jgi:hypothetical protein
LMFVKDSKTVVLTKKGYQHDEKEEKGKENFLLCGLVQKKLGYWIRFMLTIVEIHTLSNDLRRNLS